MIIIGEKINGAIPSVKRAIEEKDEQFIRKLAIDQAEAGADYIDVCASVLPEYEVETLIWLMDIVQNAVEKPLCIDSPNPRSIEAVFSHAKIPGIINSISGENDKCEVIFPLLKGTDWQVIALTCDNRGIPKDVETRINIAADLVEQAARYDITPDRIHLDPLVIALASYSGTLASFVEATIRIKQLYPTIKITSGLSNISYSMPFRKAINQAFLTIAVYSGMDSAIIDPLSRDMIAAYMATEALTGRDRGCRKYSKAFREGRIGPKKEG